MQNQDCSIQLTDNYFQLDFPEGSNVIAIPGKKGERFIPDWKHRFELKAPFQIKMQGVASNGRPLHLRRGVYTFLEVESDTGKVFKVTQKILAENPDKYLNKMSAKCQALVGMFISELSDERITEIFQTENETSGEKTHSKNENITSTAISASGQIASSNESIHIIQELPMNSVYSESHKHNVEAMDNAQEKIVSTSELSDESITEIIQNENETSGEMTQSENENVISAAISASEQIASLHENTQESQEYNQIAMHIAQEEGKVRTATQSVIDSQFKSFRPSWDEYEFKGELWKKIKIFRVKLIARLEKKYPKYPFYFFIETLLAILIHFCLFTILLIEETCLFIARIVAYLYPRIQWFCVFGSLRYKRRLNRFKIGKSLSYLAQQRSEHNKHYAWLLYKMYRAPLYGMIIFLIFSSFWLPVLFTHSFVMEKELTRLQDISFLRPQNQRPQNQNAFKPEITRDTTQPLLTISKESIKKETPQSRLFTLEGVYLHGQDTITTIEDERRFSLYFIGFVLHGCDAHYVKNGNPRYKSAVIFSSGKKIALTKKDFLRKVNSQNPRSLILRPDVLKEIESVGWNSIIFFGKNKDYWEIDYATFSSYLGNSF
jgi:hypothetical protein